MSDIKYVCLSDMHFGAYNSLLSRVDDSAVYSYSTAAGERRPLVPGDGAPSPVLEGLVNCISQLIGDINGSERPTLILNGDILELALAEDNIAAMEFGKFVELAISQEGLFSEIIFLPGNHDHHLWETAREKQYADYVANTTPGVLLEKTWHNTVMRGDVLEGPLKYRAVEAELVRGIMRRQGVTLPADVHYPTYGIFGADGAGGNRAAVFHHGHYTESTYLLMTGLQRSMFPKQPQPTEIWHWESENFAWIDFVWSTLGRSGIVGTDVGLIYDLLKDEEARDQVANALTDAIMNELPRRNEIDRLLEAVGRHVVKGVVDVALGGVSAMERLRKSDNAVPSSTLIEGLTTLLCGPLASQIEKENAGSMPSHTTFVFGHTHKPYMGAMSDLDRYPNGVDVYNTGGWVVDECKPDPRQGASVVLLDNQLQAVSLNIYRQQPEGSGPCPIVLDTARREGNTLFDRLGVELSESRLQKAPWSDLALAIADQVPRRTALVAKLISIGRAQLQS